VNKNEGNVFLIGDFDDSMEGDIIIPFIRQIQHQTRLVDGRIDLYINSFGGYAHLAFQLISLVEMAKRENIIVRTIVPDVAYSAGSLLAVTGSPGYRFIERKANHLVHYGTAGGSNESTPEQLQRIFEEKGRHFKKMRQHYLDYTNIPPEELDRLMNDDMAFIPAAKCIRWGMADGYMDKFFPGTVND
jgi:ATP-dependent protease ClpP protease subunit